MAEPARKTMTGEEFFAWQERQDRNYELVDGVPVLFRRRVVLSEAHAEAILANAARVLADHPAFTQTVVVEALRPSTSFYGLFQRLERYKQPDTVRVILLADTEAPQVAIWRRNAEEWSFSEKSGPEAVVDLPEIAAALPLANLFDGLDFPDPAVW